MVINYNKLLFIVKESKWMLFLLLFVDFGVMLGHSMERTRFSALSVLLFHFEFQL